MDNYENSDDGIVIIPLEEYTQYGEISKYPTATVIARSEIEPSTSEGIDYAAQESNRKNELDQYQNGVDSEQYVLLSDHEETDKLTSNDVAHNENKDPTLEDANVMKKNVRKKIRNESRWKCNERKVKHQAGEAYVSRRKKQVPAKEVENRKDCLKSCRFKCSQQISLEMRQHLFKSYYKLTQNEKHLLLVQLTERSPKQRSTKKHDDEPSRRQNTFRYYFPVNNKRIRVCKQLFLGTLCISQKPVAHSSKDAQGVPNKDKIGTMSTRQLPKHRVDDVLEHIKNFPCVEAHYCRSRSQRLYLESTLSVPKMYELYCIWCQEEGKDPVKLSMYRRLFVTNFNYGFHIPKTDRCDKCEIYKIHKTEDAIPSGEEEDHKLHTTEKEAMRSLKRTNKESGIPILIFDLQNVITCPRTEVGKFFYLQKLNLYNLTAYLSTTKTVYCAIWTEVQRGRTGNCLASAFKKIVDRLLQDNEITELITWSDSCVPQNRNSFISFAVLETLRENTSLECITMQYSLAGHGAVQEVDSAHSRIESHMKKAEFYSPLGFIRNLKQINIRHPYVIIQMKNEDFKDYEECATTLNYKAIPFSKVISLKFTRELNTIEFKTSYIQEAYDSANILQEDSVRRRSSIRRRGGGTSGVRTRGGLKNVNQREKVPATAALEKKPKVLLTKNKIPNGKLLVLKKMLPHMPELDKQYFKALLHI